MGEIILRDYQQRTYDAVIEYIKDQTLVNKLCVQLDTGGGKSVLIGELANKLPGRTLVLTHRAEILDQNSEWINGLGILHAKKNTVALSTRVVIAMVQTLDSRLKKYGIKYIGSFDNIILDEVHVDIFKKVFSKYRYENLLGFTATPVTNKRSTIKIGDNEFIKEHTLSEMFDDIVTGVTTNELIVNNFLVQDFNISLQPPNFDELRDSISDPDGYTKQSLDKVYTNRASIEVLTTAIETYCKGKKTLLFNPSTRVNALVYEALKEAYNVKLFDTVNNKAKEREGVVEWFKNEREAILIGTNIFTTGFNVTDIEVVIVNRATKSLGLWLQMVGRGARPTDKILKEQFTVIDLGQNIERHGRWSKTRDWKKYFFPGPLRRKKQVNLIETWECQFCGALTPSGEVLGEDKKLRCIGCGSVKPPTQRGLGEEAHGTLVPLDKPKLPNGESIIAYTKKYGESDSTFAFKILDQKIIDLFIGYGVTKKFYQDNIDRFFKRVQDIYRPIYFAIIRDKQLFGVRKKLKTQTARLLTKINKYYEHQG